MPTSCLQKPSYIHTSRGRFAYLEAGDPTHPLVLCLHGFPDHAHTWMHLLPTLAEAGYHVIAPWLRGYAPSCLEGPFLLETLRDDLIELSQQLSHGRPTYLVGHDWGAVITCLATAQAPQYFEKAVTLAVPHALNLVEQGFTKANQHFKSRYILFFQLPLVSELFVRRQNFRYIDELWQRWSPNLKHDPVFHEELKLCLRQSMPAPLDYYRAITRPLGPAIERLTNPHRAEREIHIPTLHIQGGADGCIGSECLQGQSRFYKGPFQEVIVPNAGHFLHLEEPERVGELIKDWFQPS